MATLISSLLSTSSSSTGSSSSDEDWRSDTGYHTDKMFALDTLESYDDFSSRAALYESASSSTPFNVDLIIHDLDFSFGEHIQIEQFIGNGFAFIPFGKDLMGILVTGSLPDTKSNYSKDSLLDIYRNYWRLEAVARRGKAPVLAVPNAAISCAAASLEITDTADAEDIVTFTASLIVFRAVFHSSEHSICYDYIHGTELSTTGTVSSTTSTSSTSDLAISSSKTSSSTTSTSTSSTTSTSSSSSSTTTSTSSS